MARAGDVATVRVKYGLTGGIATGSEPLSVWSGAVLPQHEIAGIHVIE